MSYGTYYYGQLLDSYSQIVPYAGSASATGSESARKYRLYTAVLETVTDTEDSEFRKTDDLLEALRQKAVARLNQAFAASKITLKSMHEKMQAILAQARSEVRQSQQNADLTFTPVTARILYAPLEKKAPNYTQCASDVTEKLLAVAQGFLTFPARAEDFFPKTNKATPKGAGQQKGKRGRPKQRADSDEESDEPSPAKRPKTVSAHLRSGTTCSSCCKSLTASNFVQLDDHADCFVCLNCIKKNNIYLKCAFCHLGYSKESKSIIDDLCPGLMKKLAKNKLQKAALRAAFED